MALDALRAPLAGANGMNIDMIRAAAARLEGQTARPDAAVVVAPSSTIWPGRRVSSRPMPATYRKLQVQGRYPRLGADDATRARGVISAFPRQSAQGRGLRQQPQHGGCNP